MTSEELREKLIEILKQPTIHSNPNLMHTEKADPILSLIKQGIEEAEPKDWINDDDGGSMTANMGYNQGKSDYKSNLLQMVEGKKI